MKSSLAIIIVFLFLSCSGKNIIEYPDFTTCNEYISVYSIELTDTATILKGNVYHRPNYWVSISSSTILKGKQTDKTYGLLSSPEYELDKKVFMPENGTLPFTLFFEPIDKEDISLDFIEDERIDIAGLSLKKREGRYRTKIAGAVIGQPNYTRIALSLYGSDLRVNKWISIPVIDGKFSYELLSDSEDAYELMFWNEYMNGAWTPFNFFSDNSEIILTCDFTKESYSRYSVETHSPINKELFRYEKERLTKYDYKQIDLDRDSLMNNNLFYTLETQELINKASNEPDRTKQGELFDELNRKIDAGEGYTPEGKDIITRYEELDRLQNENEMEYIKQKNPGLPNYLHLARKILFARSMETVKPYIEIYNKTYAPLFPGNRLTELIQYKIGSTKLAQGGKYIDFTAPDLEGNEYTLSELIEGKVAIINLWASWCGPCRRHSIDLIPIYQEYKDKGFTVIAVARENNNTKAMEKAIKQDQYPWLNLVELNDRQNLWNKYGAGNGGGIIVMVDKEGTVIAVNPSTEEIRAKLKRM